MALFIEIFMLVFIRYFKGYQYLNFSYIAKKIRHSWTTLVKSNRVKSEQSLNFILNYISILPFM